jgi:hypothetical protein
VAVCMCCGREMLTADSCLRDEDAIPYGRESYFNSELPTRCHDCGVAVGGVHHPGCDMEACPACHGQLISCSCGEEAVH